ncbi:hypothetical protein VNI00_005805 [Paramarasmius palmivorus]|uniref:Uncharacterized protein n=1 Tax=Paramarasmius palmivorus TaxID=297713 RepID=A0AAW0DCS7_9AGAR
MSIPRRQRSNPAAMKQCDICSGWFTPGGGFAAHRKACEKKKITENENMAYRVQQELQSAPVQQLPQGFTQPRSLQAEWPIGDAPEINSTEDSHAFSFEPEILPPQVESGTMLDDIRTDFHTASGRPTEQTAFEEFGIAQDDGSMPYDDSTPWYPFPSLFDFEVADLALRCSMNRQQTEKLLKLLERSSQGEQPQMKNYDQMQKLWEAAADRSTRFQHSTISVPYKEENRVFDVYYRPLWDWILEMVKHPQLAPQMEWDARRHYRFDGTGWERFINEPWTADDWWDAQTKINSHIHPSNLDAKPLCLIIYVDKNKLSSFGTAKGYPVIAAIGNLPSDIRNGGGIGGGRVVGWHPVIEEESKHSKKTSFVDFKAIVWHQSALKMFESVEIFCEVGCVMDCGDGVRRLLYPILLILSADYEEQCAMCLIRGLRSLHPCPKCMVGKEQLSQLSERFNERTPEDTARVLNDVASLTLKGDRDDLLKEYSLRYGQNAFLSFVNFNPYSAVSFDDLHFDDSGLWGAHLFPQLKGHLAKIGRHAEAEVDRRFKSFPRWRDLNHFDAVITVTFNDGTKHRDISKMFLFASESVFGENEDRATYQLLRCTRAYLNVIMYAGLHVQTASTMHAGRQSVLTLLSHLTKYIRTPKHEDLDVKSWEFIKLHYHSHLFDDIQKKGALRNFSTRPFEKKHGPIRVIYQRRTNFKNIAPQILNITHQVDVADLIWSDIHALEEYKQTIETRLQEESPADVEEVAGLGGGHFSIGSKLKKISFAQLGVDYDLQSDRFRIDLANFMSATLNAHGKPLPNGQWIRYSPQDSIVPFQFLRVNYESHEDWKVSTDYLRCNPKFHHRPWYDFVIFQSQDGPIFGQLKIMFICDVGDIQHPVAYIQSYKVVNAVRRSRSDKDLGILRLEKDKIEFISIHSIVRGALVVPAAATDVLEEERLVVDVIDSDMFLRVKKHWPGYTA